MERMSLAMLPHSWA